MKISFIKLKIYSLVNGYTFVLVIFNFLLYSHNLNFVIKKWDMTKQN